MYDTQPMAVNTFDNPERVIPKKVKVDGNNVILPPLSWNVLRYEVK